ncbi:hypothetical protein AQUCO_03000156v1 [Aquilegia coerulea]|uniref:At2g35280-like TPR domain-containing protein n=1 Tax=Aquilegia coerulea TaxID=218851 RepID=A0A2G5D1H5_AQUCA|nr:hypothetical protein AQUCO_03000156v1 [Aquilegia coerulea]
MYTTSSSIWFIVFRLDSLIKKKMHPFTETIPNDLVATIVARVASSSLADLFNLKQTCKSLYGFGEDDLVYKQVSMEKFPDLPWTLPAQAAFFLQRCQETENPEALFRLGMVEYFSHGQVELGRAFLARAVCFGHIAASYVLGIILLCTDRQSILEGMELLKSVQRFNKVSKIRIKNILAKMWKNHFIVPEGSICSDPNCNKNKRMSNKGWTLEDDNNEEDIDCDACRCDEQVRLFYKILRGS